MRSGRTAGNAVTKRYRCKIHSIPLAKEELINYYETDG
jgi:hypothetical protein